MKFKPRYLYVLGLLLCFSLIEVGFADENNIGGSARIAGMGFSQVAGNLGLLANPASFDHSKGSLVMSRSELYGIGVFYNYWEGAIRLLPSWRIGFRYESLSDQDQIDYSGYSQQLFAIGATYKVNERLKFGVSLNKSQYNLFEENIGKGYSYDLGIITGPFKINKSSINLGLKIEDISAHRNYKTDRVENAEQIITFGSSIGIGKISCGLDIKPDELRFGVEYQVISSLALRAGLADGQPTFGIGVFRGGLQIDYAYWLSEIGATHRVGSSISF